MNDTIEANEATLSELEGMKQSLLGLLDLADIEAADAEKFGAYGGNISSMAAYGGSTSKWKGKDVSHLQQSVLEQFKYLDEDSDDEQWGDIAMFTTNGDDKESQKLQQQIERELAAAMKKEKKAGGRGAAKLLKAAVNVDYDPSMDAKEDDDELDLNDVEAQLAETLDRADDDVTEIQKKMEAISSMTGKQIKMDFHTMTGDQIAEHCEDTWEQLEDGKEQQIELKKTQENVVGHLVETNEWLFSALQETLNAEL